MDNELIWQGKPWRAFKTFAILFSFAFNLILLLIIFLALPLLIPGVDSMVKPLVGGLSDSFVQMGEARIQRTITVDDDIPVSFMLPLEQNTSVVLVEPVPMTVPATFNLPAGGGTINGVVTLQLPHGTELPVALDMQVPVSNTLPVQLDVAVDIPLQETDLGKPFNNLQALFTPIDRFLGGLPGSNDELMRRLDNQAERGQTDRADASSSASP